ncbi:hypothetical protein CMI37_17970 [Candidatus Pacearchaeota archaeon]|nr:hypothetical protein [Candidatus Pacearchaeota archaeon]
MKITTTRDADVRKGASVVWCPSCGPIGEGDIHSLQSARYVGFVHVEATHHTVIIGREYYYEAADDLQYS